jgi:hypothetical protein
MLLAIAWPTDEPSASAEDIRAGHIEVFECKVKTSVTHLFEAFKAAYLEWTAGPDNWQKAHREVTGNAGSVSYPDVLLNAMIPPSYLEAQGIVDIRPRADLAMPCVTDNDLAMSLPDFMDEDDE